MLNGLYISTAGALVQSARQEIIANNLANVNTSGFRRQMAIFSRRPPESQERASEGYNIAGMQLNPLLERIDGGVFMDEVATVHEGGPLTRTGGDYDFAISGEGFFVCENANGERFYTRSGNFLPSKDGYLMTPDGEFFLLDSRGQRIHTRDPRDIEPDSIKAVTFKNVRHMRRHGENMFTSKEEPVFSAAEVKRNYIEASNVSPIVELISMIEGFRIYEANMQAIRHQDRTLGRAVNDVGRLGR
jgi:flagellar basal-body rod protein FlgG